MSLTFTKKIASSGAGRVATEPLVRVNEVGQVAFNRLAAAAVAEYAVALPMQEIDTKSRTITVGIKGIKTPASYPFTFRVGKDSYTFTQDEVVIMRHDKDRKGNPVDPPSYFFSYGKNLAAAGYDFASSGSQSFPAEVDVEKHLVTWTMPLGSAQRKPKQIRKARAPKAATVTTVAANGTPVPTMEIDAELTDALND